VPHTITQNPCQQKNKKNQNLPFKQAINPFPDSYQANVQAGYRRDLWPVIHPWFFMEDLIIGMVVFNKGILTFS
jgi:hypothetical protein